MCIYEYVRLKLQTIVKRRNPPSFALYPDAGQLSQAGQLLKLRTRLTYRKENNVQY